MPRIPGDIERRIAMSDPEKTKKGDEGILHAISFGDEAYYAKRWRGQHAHFDRGKESIVYTEESGKTPVSPFWHKVMYWEAKLVNKALPEFTLAIEAGYDPRISKDGTEYDYRAGRPVTLAKDVSNDSQASKDRNALIDAAYADNKGKVIEENGRTYGRPWATFPLVMKTDRAMAERFGREINLSRSRFNPYNPQESVGRIIEAYKQDHPNSRMLAVLEAGVLPLHAEWNFIPTAESDEGGPHGIYIETAIVDVERLRAKLYAHAQTRHARNTIDASIRRFQMYKHLDAIYTDLFYGRKDEPRWEGDSLHDAEIGQEVFRVLSDIRTAVDSGVIEFNEEQAQYVKRTLMLEVHRFAIQDETTAVERIRSLREHLINDLVQVSAQAA